MPTGNGDPRLVLFGRRITPNAHRLAEEYVLLDNLYTNGEVSQDGHAWCDSAYVTDFTQKEWTSRYSGRPMLQQDGRLSRSPGGTLWDVAGQRGLNFLNYGEGASRPSPSWRRLSRDFFGARDTDRAAVFIEELKVAEKTGVWPALMVMSLPQDHTQGLLPGTFSPVAHVANNDLALGKIVQAVSHSRFWPETAIFVIEDDAQDGPDHVDAHRTVGLVISPYVKRGAVDHTMYTQVSFVRTIELILGLPAMSQYDEAATPLSGLFSREAVHGPYAALVPNVDLNARNPNEGPGARASLQLDFTGVDRADPKRLNAIIWQALRPGEPEPAPIHGWFSEQVGVKSGSEDLDQDN